MAEGRFLRVASAMGLVRVLDSELEDPGPASLGVALCSVLDYLGEFSRDRVVQAGGAELVAAALRRCDYNVVAAVALLDGYAALAADVGAVGDCLRGLTAEDVIALQAEHGVRVLHSNGSLEINCDLDCCSVLALDAARLYDRNRGSLAESAAVGRLLLFLRICLAEDPALARNGVTVAVDVASADPRQNFSYAFATCALRLVSAFPVPLRRVVIFGPSLHIGVGWHTALRLLCPTLASLLVYISSSADSKMTIAALLPHLEGLTVNDNDSSQQNTNLAGSGTFKKPGSAHEMENAIDNEGEIVGEDEGRPPGNVADFVTEVHNVAQQAMVWNSDFGLGWYDTAPSASKSRSRTKARKQMTETLLLRGDSAPNMYVPEDVAPAVAVLKSGSMAAKILSARLLAVACRPRHTGGKAVLADIQGAHWLVWMLESLDTGERKAAAAALTSACRKCSANAAAARCAGVVPRLLNLLAACESCNVQLVFVEALAAVCENDDGPGSGEDIHRSSGEQQLLNAIARNGSDEVHCYCFVALAAALKHVETSRRKVLENNKLPDAISRILLSGGPHGRRGCAQVIAALCYDSDDRYGASARLYHLAVVLPLLDLVASLDPAAQGHGASALAACCKASDSCALDLLRQGGIQILSRACELSGALSTLLFPPGQLPEAETATKSVLSLQAEFDSSLEVCNDEDLRSYFQGSIDYLDSEKEGIIVSAEWSWLQTKILLVFAALLSKKCSSGDTADQLCNTKQGFVIFSKLACCSNLIVQGAAFNVLTGLSRIRDVGNIVALQFLDMGGDRILVNAVDQGTNEFKCSALDCLLCLSQASAKFHGRICSSGVLAKINKISSHNVHGEKVTKSGQSVLAFFSKGDAGLFHILRNGSQEAQEKASAAVWHLSAHNPKMKQFLMWVF